MSLEYIVLIIMLSLFIIGAIIFIVCLIFFIRNAGRRKTTGKKVAFGFSILGTIIGFCFIAIPVMSVIVLRSEYSSVEDNNIDTGIIITWQTKEDDGGDYFILNNKTYEHFEIDNANSSYFIETDKAIANIVPEEYQKMKWFYSLLGVDDKKTIYSLKNCNDYSILLAANLTAEGPFGYISLYCDIDYMEDKYKYYNNLGNYTFYYSPYASEYNESFKQIQHASVNVIDYLYNYKGIETDIDDKKYDYLYIFGISNDKIIHKDIMTIIIDGDNYYRKEYSRSDKILHVTIIDGALRSLLLGLFE
jgi:hypothetical protein